MKTCIIATLRRSTVPSAGPSVLPRAGGRLARSSPLASSSSLRPVCSRPYSTPPPSTSTSNTPRQCWKCLKPCPSTLSLCAHCSAIQPVLPLEEGGPNLFQLLGLPDKGSFAIDQGAIKLAFLQGSKNVHPDGFKGKEEIEYQLAQQQSSILNKAYYTLKDPLPRAQYLLSLSGIEVQESDSLMDQSLLMEILEAREALEDAESEEEVETIRAENKEKARQTVEQLGDAFEKGDLDRAKELCIELRYWDKVDEAVKDKNHPVD